MNYLNTFIISILPLIIIGKTYSQTFFETSWESDEVTYKAFVILEDEENIRARVQFINKWGVAKIAEYQARQYMFEYQPGIFLEYIDGNDGKIIYSSSESSFGYSADNFVFFDKDNIFTSDDDDLVVGYSPQYAKKVNYWKQLDPNKEFTQNYISQFFLKSEDQYKQLQKYNPDYLLSQDQNSAEWRVVMNKNPNYSNQHWIKSKDWPKNDIKEYWDKDYRITDLSYGEGVWFVSMSKNDSPKSQGYVKSINWPKNDIEEYWKDGKGISEVCYGEGKWVIISTKDENIINQKVKISSYWPKDWLKENWKEGDYEITSVERGNGNWAIVLTQYSFENRGQKILTGDEYPRDKIKEAWSEGYRITSLAFNKTWVVILTKTEKYGETYNTHETSFPIDFIRDNWDDDYYIKEVYCKKEGNDDSNYTGFTGEHSMKSSQNVEAPADPKLHLIVIANTRISDIGSACEIDKKKVSVEFEDISSSLGIKFQQHILDEKLFNISALDSVLNIIKPNSNDIVVFIYSGHGFRYDNQISQFPRASVYHQKGVDRKQNSIELESIYSKIKSKGARLSIVLSDCCNSSVGSKSGSDFSTFITKSNLSGDINKLRSLFMNSTGSVLVTSSKPNQNSCANNTSGSYFINAFLNAIDSEISLLNSDSPNWNRIIENAISLAYQNTSKPGGCSPQEGMFIGTIVTK